MSQEMNSTTEHGRSVPRLRFPEFDGEWEERKLQEYFQLVSGNHLNPDQYTNSDPENKLVPYFTGPSDFTNHHFNLTKWSLSAGKTALKNDVLITVKGNGVGTCMTLELKKVVMGRQLMAIRSNISSNYFLYQKLTTLTNYFFALASGNLIPGLSRNDILTTKIYFPSLPEQQKIAAFLTVVDTRIGQLRQKKTLLEQYKTGVMQRLFTSPLERGRGCVPQPGRGLRFKKPDGSDYPDWEEKKLGEVIEINPKTGELPNNFIYIDLESVDKGNLIKESEITMSEAPSRAQRVLSKGDVLFQMVRPYQKNNYHFKKDGNYVASTGYAQLRARENASFVYQIIHTDSFVNKVLERCTGTSYPAINPTDLGKIYISIPCLEEQTQIAHFLSAIDDKIRLVDTQLEKTQVFKKGLLQQLFV